MGAALVSIAKAQKFARLKNELFLVIGKSERIESIHFADSGLSC